MPHRGSESLLLVRAEPLTLAEMVARRMVDVVRLLDGALVLEADPAWAGAINTVLVKKGARVSELRPLKGVTAAQRPTELAASRCFLDRDHKQRGALKNLRVECHRAGAGGGVRAS